MTTLVVTANYGDHDDPPQAPVGQLGGPVEWAYYTDSHVAAPEPWVTYHVAPQFTSPNLSAKFYKTVPFVMTEHTNVIWIDANMQITSGEFVKGALRARRDGIAVWQHPRRDCIYTEADACLGAESQGGKYESHRAAIGAQIQAYLSEGYPQHHGLFACGTVAWDLSDPRVRDLGSLWLDECVRWSPQDQLSLPVVAWRLGVNPGVYPIAQIDRRYSTRARPGNQWLRILPHRPARVPQP